jgi:hypothetical protein
MRKIKSNYDTVAACAQVCRGCPTALDFKRHAGDPLSATRGPATKAPGPKNAARARPRHHNQTGALPQTKPTMPIKFGRCAQHMRATRCLPRGCQTDRPGPARWPQPTPRPSPRTLPSRCRCPRARAPGQRPTGRTRLPDIAWRSTAQPRQQRRPERERIRPRRSRRPGGRGRPGEPHRRLAGRRRAPCTARARGRDGATWHGWHRATRHASGQWRFHY